MKHLRTYFPNHAIFGEEKGFWGGNSRNGVIVVDPVDGSRNCFFGIPFWCISIALLYPGEININNVKIGIIWSPILHECFIAEKNKGAYLITTNKVRRIPYLTPILGYSAIDVTMTKDDFKFLGLLKKIGALRHLGSIALALAYTAAGRLLATISFGSKIRIIDVLAGSLIVREAGGIFKVLKKQHDYISFIATLKKEVINEIFSF